MARRWRTEHTSPPPCSTAQESYVVLTLRQFDSFAPFVRLQETTPPDRCIAVGSFVS